MPKSSKYYIYSDHPSFTRKLLFSVCFLLGSLGLVLILFEITLRVRGDFLTYSERNWGEYRSIYKPLVGDYYNSRKPFWKNKSNGADFSANYTFNSMGFRDREHVLEKPETTYRIVVLGDSWVESPGVHDDSTWVRIAERMLNLKEDSDSSAQIQYELIAAGNSGSDVYNHFHVLKDKMLPFQPDLIVHLMNGSDYSEVLVRGGWERFQENGSVTYRDIEVNELAYEYSHCFRFFLHSVLRYRWELISPSNFTAYTEDSREMISQTIMDIKYLSASANSSFYCLVHPTLDELTDGKYIYPLRELNHDLDKLNVKNKDLWTCIKSTAEGREVKIEDLYFPTDLHFNSVGHQILAECFVRSIEEESLLGNN